MRKEKYEAAKIEIITFTDEDIITTSGEGTTNSGDTVLPIVRFY